MDDKPSWKIRRRIIIGTILYFAGLSGYLSVFRETTPLTVQIIIALIGAIVGIVTAYITGAVWDDKNQKR